MPHIRASTGGPPAKSISKLSPGSPHNVQLARHEMLWFLADHQRGACAVAVTVGGSTSRRCAHRKPRAYLATHCCLCNAQPATRSPYVARVCLVCVAMPLTEPGRLTAGACAQECLQNARNSGLCSHELWVRHTKQLQPHFFHCLHRHLSCIAMPGIGDVWAVS